jgi:5-methylcytosine-specific restriction endonuclease McrA
MTGNMSARRRILFKAQEGKCIECSRVCTLDRPTRKMREFTVDHVIPKRLGGTNAYTNLAGLCFHCNSKKAGQMPSSKLLQHIAKRTISETLLRVEKEPS